MPTSRRWCRAPCATSTGGCWMPPESARTLSASQLTTYRDALLKVQASGQGNPDLQNQALQAGQQRLQELSGLPSQNPPGAGTPPPAPTQPGPSPEPASPAGLPPPSEPLVPPSLSGPGGAARPHPAAKPADQPPLSRRGKGRRFSAASLPKL